ncbi:prealbumin-like fold domain-containing protein [Rhodococcus sp. F64268]|uniref:MSCRAMM family protein n=1 Tax=Rhodococcus sp. F64268 TaxID=2926402 RepID=UPI001FF4C815|nr:SpaA isopeptide-forming pilin-related protein [Rhodococcus sp. F64268]MCK0092607.1 prealbumin-like fold domain-containing protein [Rhodococcus sp. F64268]
MRTPSRVLSVLFGSALVVALSGVALADPSETVPTTTEITATTTVPSTTVPTTTAPSLPTTSVNTDPAPPDVGIEMGTVAIRAATLSDDQPVAGVSVEVARCDTGEIVGTPATGPEGTASVSVPLGCHTATAVGFPDGYDPVSVGPWQVEVTAPGQVQSVGFTFARWAPPGEGTIDLRARDLTTGTPIAGVTASVRSCVEDGPYGYLTTDLDGAASATFPLNCYEVTATTIPAGSTVVSGGPFTVELDAPGVVRSVEVILDRSSPPDPPTPTVQGRIIKMDRISGSPLEGAIFVVGPCNSEWNHREVTGADGLIPLLLAPGCYVAKEISAPDGYIADTAPITFTATEGEYFTVQALNMPENPGPVFRNPDLRVPVRSIPAGPVERP